MNKILSFFKKMTFAKWLAMLILSLVFGVLSYALAIKFAFKPDINEIYNVGIDILFNLTNPNLKTKAYICVFALVFMPTIIWGWFLIKLIIFLARKDK